MKLDDIIPEMQEPSKAVIEHAETRPEDYHPAMMWQLGFMACMLMVNDNIERYKKECEL